MIFVLRRKTLRERLAKTMIRQLPPLDWICLSHIKKDSRDCSAACQAEKKHQWCICTNTNQMHDEIGLQREIWRQEFKTDGFSFHPGRVLLLGVSSLCVGFLCALRFSPESKTKILGLLSSRCPWPNVLMRIWIWPLGVAQRLPTAPQYCIYIYTHIYIYSKIYFHIQLKKWTKFIQPPLSRY